MGKIDIQGLDKAELLVELHQAARKQPFTFPWGNRRFVDIEKARQVLAKSECIGQLRTKVLMVDLRGDEMSSIFFNRENGADTAEAAIERVRSRKKTTPHASAMRRSTNDAVGPVWAHASAPAVTHHPHEPLHITSSGPSSAYASGGGGDFGGGGASGSWAGSETTSPSESNYSSSSSDSGSSSSGD